MRSAIRKLSKKFEILARRVNPFKGQKGQDKWVVFSALPLKRKGFFLDLAAADGVANSNTYVLEKLFGWDGICIEPNPCFFVNLKRTRACILDDSVVSDKRGRVDFRVDNGELGGIVAEDTDNNWETRADQLSSSELVSLEAFSLNEILDRYSAPENIDYFSLDVEGSEERIIEGFDFSKYRFSCLTIERPTPRVNATLFENGYVFVKNKSYDSFYVHSSLVETGRISCQPFEQVPRKDW